MITRASVLITKELDSDVGTLGGLCAASVRPCSTQRLTTVFRALAIRKRWVLGLGGSENRGGSEAQPVIRVCCSP